MVKRKQNFNPDADLDEDVENYEPSDSDDDYDDNEKLLLEKVRKGKALHEEDDDDDEEDSDNEEEVLGIYSSDEEKEDRAKNNDSDIEGMEDEKLPDSKAWGKRKKDYYYTDYVDQDYGGFAREEEEEVAMMEEKEARTLQSRLAAQLDDVDLSLGLLSKDKKKDDVDDDIGLEDDDVVKTDLSKLTKREKLTLFQKESPEFFGLVNDYKERLTYAKDKLFPVMKLIKAGHIPSNLPCSKFVELKIHLTLNYCTNVAFYIVLKTKRIPIKDHPVTERLLKYRTLLQQLDGLQNDKYIEQLDEIIEQFKNNENLETSDAKEIKNKSSKNKKKLNLLSTKENDIKITKSQKRKLSMSEGNTDAILKEEIAEDASENESNLFDDSEDNSDVEETPAKKLKNSVDSKISKQEDGDGKRAITYEMAKNKGLTPYRKKEQRNPRVKHRNKYRKALIRRKGQVRQVQKEVTKYGGEIFGIKASVIKSRKLK